MEEFIGSVRKPGCDARGLVGRIARCGPGFNLRAAHPGVVGHPIGRGDVPIRTVIAELEVIEGRADPDPGARVQPVFQFSGNTRANPRIRLVELARPRADEIADEGPPHLHPIPRVGRLGKGTGERQAPFPLRAKRIHEGQGRGRPILARIHPTVVAAHEVSVPIRVQIDAQPVSDDALLEIKGGLRDEIHRSTQGVRRLVRRVALGDLDFLDEICGDLVDQRRPVALRREPGDSTRGAGAIQRDRVEFRRCAAQADADDIARLFVHRDAGEILQKVADVSVSHVAVGIHRDHALDVLGDALPRDRRGIAFALPGHRERVQAHGRPQGDVEFRCAPVSNNDGLQRNVEAGVENPH